MHSPENDWQSLGKYTVVTNMTTEIAFLDISGNNSITVDRSRFSP
jgi:tricorn protease-like protein